MRENTITAPFIRHRVVCTFVKHLALGGQPVLAPLLLNMDECPLAWTEAKMLNPRYCKEVLLAILRYPIILNETPCGIALSLIATQ